MPNKTFWIPDDEVPMWEAAQRVAKKRRTSLYRIVSDAVRRDLPRVAAETPEDEWAHIAADVA